MLLTHTSPHCAAVRPVVAPASSIGSTLAAMQFLYHGSIAATLAAAPKSKR